VAGWWLIPRFGTAGAALATAAAAALGVVGSAMALHRMWRIGPPWMSILRGLVLCVAAYALAASWPTPGFLLLVKLTVISALIGAGFLMLREFTPREIALIRSVIPRKARDVVGSH